MPKYNSVNNIPAKVFFEILYKKDYELLQRENETEELDKIFSDIYDDYFIQSENEKAKEFLGLRENIAFLVYKVESIKQVVQFLFENKTTREMREMLLDALISIGVNVNKEADFLDEVQNILQIELGIIENDINLSKMELESIQENNEDVVFNFYESLIALESAHERSLDDEMVLAKYIQYEKIAIKKARLQQQKNVKFNTH